MTGAPMGTPSVLLPTTFLDSDVINLIQATVGSPSDPVIGVDLVDFNALGDQGFLDIDLNCLSWTQQTTPIDGVPR